MCVMKPKFPHTNIFAGIRVHENDLDIYLNNWYNYVDGANIMG